MYVYLYNVLCVCRYQTSLIKAYTSPSEYNPSSVTATQLPPFQEFRLAFQKESARTGYDTLLLSATVSGNFEIIDKAYQVREICELVIIVVCVSHAISCNIVQSRVITSFVLVIVTMFIYLYLL